ncbi:aldo/keto reductase, partial [Candidatus Shapirobacteria bacterium]|nr:aldo/keto reductase [Candidatus Shapirobacteria bacterium]
NNIWRPLRQGKTVSHNWELLVGLAKKYNKTQSQIILNWMISNECFPMIFSANTDHIKENFESQNFKVDKNDLELMDNYRIENYRKPKVDWDKTGDGISVALLPDVFEENLETK